jgi:hypothetical protein
VRCEQRYVSEGNGTSTDRVTLDPRPRRGMKLKMNNDFRIMDTGIQLLRWTSNK